MTKNFPVIYEWSGRNFSGFAPDVPGCVSTARTLPKMRAMLKEALEGHLQWMYDDGDALPQPNASVTVDMSEDLEFPNPPGYYVVVEQLPIDMPAAKSNRSSNTSARALAAA